MFLSPEREIIDRNTVGHQPLTPHTLYVRALDLDGIAEDQVPLEHAVDAFLRALRYTIMMRLPLTAEGRLELSLQWVPENQERTT